MILNIYITMLPLILGGIVNMIFVKTTLYKRYQFPIDGYRNWRDGKRIFGNNKTVIGFFSMVIFCGIFQVLWGLICNLSDLNTRNELYLIFENTIFLNMIVGFLFGFAYMLFELPNSFIKRRLDIDSGGKGKGFKGVFFFIVDQIDSLIGVFLVLMLFNGMSWGKYFIYLCIGGFTHILVNLLLVVVRVRRRL